MGIATIVMAGYLPFLGVPRQRTEKTVFQGTQKMEELYKWIDRHKEFLTFDKPTINCVFVRICREIEVEGATQPVAIYSSPIDSLPIQAQIQSVITGAVSDLGFMGTMVEKPPMAELTFDNNRYTLKIRVDAKVTVNPPLTTALTEGGQLA